MKRFLALIITLLLLTHSPIAKAQALFRLAATPAAKQEEKLLFGVHVKAKRAKEDSTIRVVQVYSQGNHVISYRLLLITDSAGFHSSIMDSVVRDTALYDQLRADTSSKPAEHRAVLVATADPDAESPVEDIYYYSGTGSPAQDVVAGRLKELKDSAVLSVPRKNPVSVHGNITAIGQASDNRYQSQGIPQNYVRSYINTDIEVYGVPFSMGYYYTTENNSGLNKINNFRLSFQYDRFYRNLKDRMEQKLQSDKQDKIRNVTRIDIGNLNKELLKLQQEVNQKEYRRLTGKNEQILALGEKDPSFKNSYKYKKALQHQQEHQSKLDRLKEIDRLKAEHLKYSQVADYNTRIKELNLSRPKDFRKGAKRFGLLKPGQSIFMSVKKLDLGTFDPDYTTLVLSGVSLTGVNIELNPGNLYGAFTWGKAVSNFNNPWAFSSLAGGRNIMAGRIGLGQKEKLLVAMSILKGTDDAGNMVKDSAYNYYLPNYNYVVGADIKYKISEQAEAGIEYAKSQSREIAAETRSTGEQLGNLVNPGEGKYSSAWYAYTRFNVNENRTRIKASTRVVDPFYYSFGTPYLRRDNFRIELKGEQLFWKNQLTAGITYRRDRDNLYDLKQGTSINNTLIFSTQIRIRKYPYLLLTYSPNYQSFYNSAVNRQINSTVTLYSAVAGYTYQNKKLTASSTFSYSKQYNQSNQAEWPAFDVSQYGFYENVTFKRINLTLNSGINYALPKQAGDTGRLFSARVQCSKGLFKNKISVTGGYRYQKDFTIEERNIAEAGTSFGLGWGISCQIIAEKHFIRSYTILNPATDMFLGRITLIKTF